MAQKFICPDCHEKEVERLDACGASSYFCNHCKKLIASSRIKEMQKEEKKN